MKRAILLLVTFLSMFTLTAQNSLVNGWDSVPVILARIIPPSFPATTFNIVDYGAVGNGSTLCRNAINNAITACNAAGGGKVIVPAGTFLTGAIQLKSNVNLYISAGATLRFSTNPVDYLPVVFTRFEGVECYNYSPFIYAYQQTNIAITGSGTLDGNASSSDWWGWKTSGDADRTNLLAMGQSGTPVASRIFGTGYKIRPVFIQPHSCTKILIDSVTILKSPMWEINPVLCTNVTVSHVTISSHGVNNDGCNPECSKDVWIHHCLFDTGDDCIAIKSGRNNDGRRVNVASENIVIQNCTMQDGHGGVVLGSEISGNVRNVFAESCVMSSPNLDRALRVKTNSVRGGIIENIFLRNIQVPLVASSYIEVDMNYEEGDIGVFTPIVRNFSVETMTGSSSPKVFNVNCYARSPISNFLLKNCTLTATALGTYVNMRKLQVVNTTVNGSVPLIPTATAGVIHAGAYSSKNNWGWSNVKTAFTGNGYMEPVDVDNSIEFNITAASNECDALVFTYVNPSVTSKNCVLYVNGVEQTSVSFNQAANWTTKTTYVNLTTGVNTLKLVADGGIGELYFDKFTATYFSAPLPAASLTNPANKSQQITFGDAIANIVFTWGGGATDVTVTNLPAGLIATKNAGAKTVTISGTPTVSGSVTYTVTTVGGIGPTITLSGTIQDIICLNLVTIPITSLAATGNYSMVLFDAAGTTQIKVLADGNFNAGNTDFKFSKVGLASGTYTYKLMDGATVVKSGTVVLP
jgi:polygalacturonase